MNWFKDRDICKKKSVPEETINEINARTLNYVKHCKNMRPSRNVELTKQYLKQNPKVAWYYNTKKRELSNTYLKQHLKNISLFRAPCRAPEY